MRDAEHSNPRYVLLDTARGVLIVLVVWGHLLESKGFGGQLYFSIYTFHIPAFALISGMLSKSSLDLDGVLKILLRLGLPLLIFQALYLVALGLYAPFRLPDPFAPVWSIWFLVSLLTWKLVLPIVVRLPFPLMLTFGLALIAGYWDWVGTEFSLSRTLVFLPAFVFGHLYGERLLEAIVRYRGLLIVVFVAGFGAAYFVSEYVNVRWLWGSKSYSELPFQTPGALFRAAAIIAGLVMSVAFLSLVPSASRPLAYLGRRTMPIYLVHGIPVILFWVFGPRLQSDLWFSILTATLAVAISVSIAWSGDLVKRSGLVRT